MKLSVPFRSLIAALTMGAAGAGIAWAVTVVLTTLAVPSLDRLALPAAFAYGPPAWWSQSTAGSWVVGILGLLVFPFLFNPGWISRATVSVRGVVKVAAAALLFALIAAIPLFGSDLFGGELWNVGGNVPVTAYVARVLMAGLCGGLLFAVLGEGMMGGNPDRWIQPGVARAATRRAFAFGFAAAVIAAWLALLAADSLNLLVQALFGFLSESAETSPIGWRRLLFGLSLGLSLVLATTAALLVALAPGAVDRSRRLRSIGIAATPAVVLVAVSLWFDNYCRTQGQMNATLSEVAHLEAPPPARLMVLPGNAASRLLLYPMEASVPTFSGSDVIGASRANVERAQDYLRDRGGRWTAHTVGAWQVAPSVYDRMLEPEAALRARLDAAEATGSVLAAAIAIGRISSMRQSEELQYVSARLRDPSRFVAGEQAGVRLQGSAAVVRDRALNGVVRLSVAHRSGARVALYKQGDAKPPAFVPYPAQLVAATALPPDGRFSFSRVPPAIYAVGVLLPESAGADTTRVAVQGVLRIVDLTTGQRSQNVGAISISIQPR